ncbi:hypothetical protein B4U80_03076 [Leptotrombidium deliense]|uniref:ISXO2-like transposase domain-containing protein n=1 Tax=Leptotrombidium deliense TaxID=299467 RepID=A0A443RYY7_9ACAR|nr:hypothetical protein B4U80_03076 [Leptotrombidium deliense]
MQAIPGSSGPLSALSFVFPEDFSLKTFGKYIHDSETALQFAIGLRIIPDPNIAVACPVCQRPMVFKRIRMDMDCISFRARCPTRSHKKANLPLKVAVEHSGLSTRTVVNWYSMCREVCEIVMSNEDHQIGGPDMTVEVDETFLTKRKYNKGRITRGHDLVLFGMYCRETKEGLYFHVPNKRKQVLWAFMERYIAPGTKIMSDGAPMYVGCEALDFASHDVVIHKHEFVRSDNPNIHTNNIEVQNRWLKVAIKSRRNNRQLHSYIAKRLYWRCYPGRDGNGLVFKMADVPDFALVQMDEEELETSSDDESVWENWDVPSDGDSTDQDGLFSRFFGLKPKKPPEQGSGVGVRARAFNKQNRTL